MKLSFVMRTHLWNESAEANFKSVCAMTQEIGDSFIGFDSTNFKDIDKISEQFPVIEHNTNDFMNIGLPSSPESRFLWYYGDYVIYKFMEQLDSDYICIYEYDFFMSKELIDVCSRVIAEKIDAVSCFIMEASDGWIWRNPSEIKYKRLQCSFRSIPKIYQTIFPFLIINRKASNYLLQRRLAQIHSGLNEGVFCEPFFATELKSAGFLISGLNTLGIDISKISIDIPILFNNQMEFDQFKHPVLMADQFIPKAIACLRAKKQFGADVLQSTYARINSTIMDKDISEILRSAYEDLI